MHELALNVFKTLGSALITLILFILIFEGVNPTAINPITTTQAPTEASFSARSMIYSAYDKQLNKDWARRTMNDGKMRTEYMETVWKKTNEI